MPVLISHHSKCSMVVVEIFVSDQLRGVDICKLTVAFNGTNLYAFANGSINTIEPFRYIIESPLITSSDVIQVILDGKSLNFDQPPIMDDNRVMVPIRTMFEALGYTVNWQNSTQTAIANKAGHSIIVQVNNPKITYNGGSYYCDVSPKNLSGRILVPCEQSPKVLAAKLFGKAPHKQS